MKVLLLIGVSLGFYLAALQADEAPLQLIHSNMYGTWSPPSSLFTFWKGIQDDWWNPDHPNVQAFNLYFEKYVKSHQPQETIPQIFLDLQRNADELHFAIYSGLIRDWNRKDVMAILNHYYSFKEGTAEHSIADNFIADIEKEEAHSKDKSQ